jgi:uncharacterized protein (TIGR02231 family)
MQQHPVLILSLLLTFYGTTTRAEEGKIVVPSTLKSATVYRSGAELVHTTTAHLAQGNNELIIEDVSNAIDAASIHIGCSGDVTIMSVTFSTDYLKPEVSSPFVKKLQDSIAFIKKELARLEVLSKSDNELLDLLNANKSIGSASTGVSVAELSKMMDYYRQKVMELKTELNVYNDKTQQWKQISDKLESQIMAEEKKNSKTGGSLVLQLLSPLAGAFDFTVSYLTPAAHWDPFYDLRVDNSTDPLRIVYKARLVQTSGIDWKHVKLSLSTSLPAQGGNAPVLKTWFLQFVDPMAWRQNFSNSLSNTLQGKAAGISIRGNSSLNDEVVTGYGVSKPEKRDEPGDYVFVNDNQMDVVFGIDIPYDVPGNGKEQGVVLKEYKMPCTYQYYAAPRIDKDAFLLGEMPGWEKLNLLPGEANIMVEGTYIGKSYIDPNSIQDTLNLTLGRDKRIVVKKEKITDYSSVKFLGANKKEVFTYQITVKNNKKEKIQLLLKDQYPISSSKEIEEEWLESSGASVNKDTGILTWKLELAAGESRKFKVSYSIKYPKEKILNIN